MVETKYKIEIVLSIALGIILSMSYGIGFPMSIIMTFIIFGSCQWINGVFEFLGDLVDEVLVKTAKKESFETTSN